MNTTTKVRTVGQRGKTGATNKLVLRVMNEWMDQDREVVFSLRDMAAHIGYTSTSVNNAVKNLRMSRKITRIGRDGYGMRYRVNPCGVVTRRTVKVRSGAK